MLNNTTNSRVILLSSITDGWFTQSWVLIHAWCWQFSRSTFIYKTYGSAFSAGAPNTDVPAKYGDETNGEDPAINGAEWTCGAARRCADGAAKTGAGAAATRGAWARIAPDAMNGADAWAWTSGAAAGNTGVAMAWFTLCALYDDAYGTIPPRATEQIERTTKICNMNKIYSWLSLHIFYIGIYAHPLRTFPILTVILADIFTKFGFTVSIEQKKRTSLHNCWMRFDTSYRCVVTLYTQIDLIII